MYQYNYSAFVVQFCRTVSTIKQPQSACKSNRNPRNRASFDYIQKDPTLTPACDRGSSEWHTLAQRPTFFIPPSPPSTFFFIVATRITPCFTDRPQSRTVVEMGRGVTTGVRAISLSGTVQQRCAVQSASREVVRARNDRQERPAIARCRRPAPSRIVVVDDDDEKINLWITGDQRATNYGQSPRLNHFNNDGVDGAPGAI